MAPPDRSRRKSGPSRAARPGRGHANQDVPKTDQRAETSRGHCVEGRTGRDRSATPYVWLYGTHASLAAVANPQRRCRRLLATAQTQAKLAAAAALVPGRPAIEICDRQALAAVLAPGAVHQGIAVQVAPLPEIDLDAVVNTLRGAEVARLVILDQASDPRNIGAVIRSAAAFGVAAVITQDRHAPAATGALAKAAAGGLERVPLVRVVNIARAMRSLQGAGFCCVGLDAAATEPIDRAGTPAHVALVLGAEDVGLRRLPRETCDILLRIPIDPASDSLNLSAAAAIALYELARNAHRE